MFPRLYDTTCRYSNAEERRASASTICSCRTVPEAYSCFSSHETVECATSESSYVGYQQPACQLVLVHELSSMVEKIRDTLRRHSRLNREISDISEDTDLYACGLTSHATVNLMLGLEDAFNVEFPERMLRRRTFETIGNIRDSIAQLTSARPAAAS